MNDSCMKLIRCRAVAALALSMLVACQSKDDLMQAPIIDGNTVSSAEEQVLLSTGSSFSMAFTADSPWTLAGRPDWLSVSKTSGRSGTTTIKISAACNETRKDRRATLVFEAKDGSFSSSMSVVQPCPYLTISVDSLSFNWNDCRIEREGVVTENNPQRIKIASNVAWRIEEVPSTKSDIVDLSHFSLSADRGTNDYDLEIIPTRDNFYKEPYDVQLKLSPLVRDENGNETELPAAAVDSYIIKLHQKNLRFLIDDSADDAEITFSELNDDSDINLTIDSEIGWTVAECPSWVVMSKESGKDVTTVNFRADGPNQETEMRSGSILLSTGATGAYREINVVQKPYVFEWVGEDIRMENDDEREYKMTLTTTGTWEIRDIPSWLSVAPSSCTLTTPESGIRDHVITFRSKGQNLDFEDYLQTLRVCSTMNDLAEEISVRQDKFVFDVDASVLLADLPTMNTLAYDVRIVSSGKWEINDIPEWVDVSSSSDEKGTYNLTIGANCGNPDVTQDRTATLSVVSLNHKAVGVSVTKEIRIKQRKYTFEVFPTDPVVIPAYKNKFDSFSATIRCSSDWSMVEYPAWIHPSITNGDGTTDVTVVFNPTVNMTKEGRNGMIRVKSLYNNQEESISISQDAFVFDGEDKSFVVPVMNTQAFSVDFELTAEAGWKLQPGYPTWLNPSAQSGYGSGSIAFTPAPNPDLVERTGRAVIQSVVSGEEKNISFQQEKYVFDSDPVSYKYTELDKTSHVIDVTSSGPWTIGNVPSWLTLSSRSGNGSASITIKPQNNTTLVPRQASFSVVSTLNNLKKEISVSQDAYKFDNTPVSYSYATLEERTDAFKILSSGSWTARSVPTWVTLSKKNGTGSEAGIEESVEITSTKNLSESERQGTIQIVSNDNASLVKNISIRQDKFDFRIDHDAFVYTSPLDVSSRTLNITCPATWTITGHPSWVSVSELSGEGNGLIVLTPQENLTVSDRSAILTVTSTLNSLKRTLTLSQPKFVFGVEPSSHTFDFPLADDNTALEVKVNCTAEWTVNTEDEWLVVSAEGGVGNGSFFVAPRTNPLLSSRKGKIVVSSTRNNLKKEIEIIQRPFEFNNTAVNLSFDACAAPDQSVDIVCSGKWNVDNTGSSWLTATPSVASGNGKLLLSVRSNDSQTGRSAVVTVTAADNPALVKTIRVTQKGHVMEVLVPDLSPIPPYPGTDFIFPFTIEGPWTAVSDRSWCTVTPNSGFGNGRVTVAIAVNASFDERSATITIACPETSFKAIWSIVQLGYLFDRTEEQLSFAASMAEDQQVSVISSGRWVVSSDQTWAIPTQSTASGNGTVSIRVEDNTSYVQRAATVTVTCLDNPAWKKTIHVTQEPLEEEDPEEKGEDGDEGDD